MEPVWKASFNGRLVSSQTFHPSSRLEARYHFSETVLSTWGRVSVTQKWCRVFLDEPVSHGFLTKTQKHNIGSPNIQNIRCQFFGSHWMFCKFLFLQSSCQASLETCPFLLPQSDSGNCLVSASLISNPNPIRYIRVGTLYPKPANIPKKQVVLKTCCRPSFMILPGCTVMVSRGNSSVLKKNIQADDSIVPQCSSCFRQEKMFAGNFE